MVLRIFRAVWFVSVLVLFAALLYGYAGWQENMIIQDKANDQISLDRDLLFYSLVATFVLVNGLVYLIAWLSAKDESFRAWFHGLIIAINVFFVIALSLIGLYNSAENYDYSRIGNIVYGSIALVFFWAFMWPAYLVYKKIFIKQPV
jgi:hypothetical protein